MPKKIRIAAGQINVTVGNIAANSQKIISFINDAKKNKADIVIFPELCIAGYPPEDLLYRDTFLTACEEALTKIAKATDGIYCIVGHPLKEKECLFNAAAIVANKKILSHYKKQILPNKGVFDEARYFTKGTTSCTFTSKNIKFGLLICEDIWTEGPIKNLANENAELVICINASPFEITKHQDRHHLLTHLAKKYHLPIFYANMIGAQDELVFDGGSMLVDKNGNIVNHAGFFNEKLFIVDVEVDSTPIAKTSIISFPSALQNIYDALVLGVRDYIHKNHFSRVLIGVSGGIDSALTVCIAHDALGKDKVHGVIMPSRYTHESSTKDALTLLNALGISYDIISIEPLFTCALDTLQLFFKNKTVDTTEENIQARMRAVILMALSNKLGGIVLNTSNRSEMAVGYSTLYGDMAGGFAVLKDVPKTLVYELAAFRNKIKAVIPENTLKRAPTAELALNQTDQDNLPPYEILDPILDLYLNKNKNIKEIIMQGFDKMLVEKVIQLIYKNEYKRRQAPIGTRINHHAFGRDRRYPITSDFREK